MTIKSKGVIGNMSKTYNIVVKEKDTGEYIYSMYNYITGIHNLIRIISECIKKGIVKKPDGIFFGNKKYSTEEFNEYKNTIKEKLIGISKSTDPDIEYLESILMETYLLNDGKNKNIIKIEIS